MKNFAIIVQTLRLEFEIFNSHKKISIFKVVEKLTETYISYISHLIKVTIGNVFNHSMFSALILFNVQN